jgi:hypothetical protein
MKSLSNEGILLREYLSRYYANNRSINRVSRPNGSADLSPKVIKDAIVKALEKIDDMATLQDILTTVAETGEYEDLGHCEQCGDWITSYTLEI